MYLLCHGFYEFVLIGIEIGVALCKSNILYCMLLLLIQFKDSQSFLKVTDKCHEFHTVTSLISNSTSNMLCIDIMSWVFSCDKHTNENVCLLFFIFYICLGLYYLFCCFWCVIPLHLDHCI